MFHRPQIKGKSALGSAVYRGRLLKATYLVKYDAFSSLAFKANFWPFQE